MNNILKNLLILSGFSAFVVIVLITVNIYLSSNISKIPEATEEILTPIAASFDIQTINSLKKRASISVNLNDKSTIIKTSEDKNTTTVATESAKPSVTLSPKRAILP